MQTLDLSKNQVLHLVARDYVLKGLGGKNFDAIPYHKDLVLRAQYVLVVHINLCRERKICETNGGPLSPRW